MAVNKFKPQAPDYHLKKSSDMAPAKLGHLNRLVDDINTAFASIGDIGSVTPLPASTNLPAVPASFADEAAVRTYLLSLVPAIETRLDTIETKINQLLNA